MKQLRKMVVQTAVIASIAAAASPLLAARGTSVINTPHNLSVGGGGGAHNIKSTRESRVCIFCHTPHHGTAVMPLWSRNLSDQTYTLYTPANMIATPQQPRGSSRLCLSCHDGTIALGLLARNYNLDPTLKSFNETPTVQGETDPRKNPNLGTDLSNDHPISFAYAVKPELQNPAALQALGIRLEEDTFLECISCHNAHNNQYGNFLVMNTDLQHDALCTTCHLKTGWTGVDTAHRTGGTRYDNALRDGVRIDGCISCHIPHTAPGGVSLLKSAQEAGTCYISCHQNPPYRNIWAEFQLPYKHPVQGAPGVHSVKESLPVVDTKEHVTCVDCHNPHQAGYAGSPLDSANPLPTSAKAPDISGPLQGVRVDNFGTLARYEYEICYNCHAGVSAESFAEGTALNPVRTHATFQEDLRFTAANPSYHPVTTDRPLRIDAGRSLKAALQALMKRIYCTDCHSPHGSTQGHILSAANEQTFPAIGTDYPLCFNCHDVNYLLDPGRVPHADTAVLHRKHVLGPHDTDGVNPTLKAPCAACHDPHGVPSARGAGAVNGAHLINFDTRYTGAAPLYNSIARSCTVAGACHTIVAPLQNY